MLIIHCHLCFIFFPESVRFNVDVIGCVKLPDVLLYQQWYKMLDFQFHNSPRKYFHPLFRGWEFGASQQCSGLSPNSARGSFLGVLWDHMKCLGNWSRIRHVQDKNLSHCSIFLVFFKKTCQIILDTGPRCGSNESSHALYVQGLELNPQRCGAPQYNQLYRLVKSIHMYITADIKTSNIKDHVCI